MRPTMCDMKNSFHTSNGAIWTLSLCFAGITGGVSGWAGVVAIYMHSLLKMGGQPLRIGDSTQPIRPDLEGADHGKWLYKRRTNSPWDGQCAVDGGTSDGPHPPPAGSLEGGTISGVLGDDGAWFTTGSLSRTEGRLVLSCEEAPASSWRLPGDVGDRRFCRIRPTAAVTAASSSAPRSTGRTKPGALAQLSSTLR